MSRLLAIETASEACSVALYIDGEIRARDYHEPRRHAALLLPAVNELLEEARIRLADLDAIAFGRGPGSFTSLRIGIGAVQGLAWGAGIGVVPVSSLAALAQAAAAHHGAAPESTLIAAMDARMGEVFHARYEIGGEGLVRLTGKESVSPPGAVELPVSPEAIGAGSGFARYPELEQRSVSLAAVYPDLWPSAENVIKLALEWLEGNEPLPAHRAQPVYIRDHVADKPG